MSNETAHAVVEVEGILEAILDASEDAIIGVDHAGCICLWNRGAERMYGYSARDLIGQPLRPPPHGYHLDEVAADLHLATTGAGFDLRDRIHRTKDNDPIEVSLTVAPIRDRAGQSAGVLAIARDRTAQHRAERALLSGEARSRVIIETAGDAIILIDCRGCLEAFNPAAERLFGYGADEVLGRNVSMLMPEPHSHDHDHYLRRYLMSGTKNVISRGREVAALRKDGTSFPAALSVAELCVDGETKFTGIIRDLTERVRLEMRLREESGLVQLGEMAAMLAHEMKNPIAAVGGAIQVLSQHLSSDDDREIADEILRRLAALSAMMSDVLLYARPPQPKAKPVVVGELVESLIAFLQRDQDWRGIQISVDGPDSMIFADGELVKVAVENVLINAVQAMDGHGRLAVRLHESDGLLHVDIADSGPGIPAHVRPQLFTPFFTTKARGTGLGLATVRRIVELHGGSVSVLASSSDGTTIRLSLPRQRTAGPTLD